jgi:hypothetical protein
MPTIPIEPMDLPQLGPHPMTSGQLSAISAAVLIGRADIGETHILGSIHPRDAP